MGLRLGLLIGASLGYYFGTRAGRERHEQINRLIDNAKNSKTVDLAEDRIRAVADVAADRAREKASQAKAQFTSNGSNSTTDSNPS